MSREEMLKDILKNRFEKLGSSLDNLKGMLEDVVRMVPAVPDVDEVAGEVSSALPQEEETTPALQPSLPSPPLNNRLLYHMANIEHAASQGDVLRQLLTGVEDLAQRAVLFVVRKDQAQAWDAFGFEDLETARKWNVSMDGDPLLQTIAGSRSRLLMDNTVPSFIPAQQRVRRSMISPLLLKGKVLSFLYADSGSSGALDHYSIDILMRAASLVIDIFPLRSKRNPLPPTLEEQPVIQAGEEPEEPEEAKVEEAAEIEEKEEEQLFEDTGTLAASAEDEEEPDLAAGQTMMAEIPVAEEQDEETPEEASTLEPVELKSGEYQEPAEEEAAKAEAPAEEEPIPEEDKKAHKDAQRFARLLVQEIALYHPKELEQGKKNGNLYKLLQEDINRSREAYDKRFQKSSVKDRDYFTKALIEHLADGDDSLLGM